MYKLSDRLDPPGMYQVALRCYRDMRASGYGAVGEFHYVHHQAQKSPPLAASRSGTSPTPRISRWKARECAFTMAGTRKPGD
jgi:hypothetical protein